jgi:hypothetical protein
VAEAIVKRLLVIATQTVTYHGDSIVCLPPDARTACRWCYGRPMDGLDVCSRVSCIQNVAWLQAADIAVASDAGGWHGDRS